MSSVLAILTLLGLACLAWSLLDCGVEPDEGGEREQPRPHNLDVSTTTTASPLPDQQQSVSDARVVTAYGALRTPPLSCAGGEHRVELRREIDVSLAMALDTGNPAAACRGLDALRRLRLAMQLPDPSLDGTEAQLRGVLADYAARGISL